jgi:hypothetical protein
VPTVAAPADLTGWLAYVQGTTIYVRPPGGGPSLALISEPQGAKVSHLRWSASGRRLLYRSEIWGLHIPESHLTVYDFDRHQRIDLGVAAQPVWHPDGEHIAITGSEGRAIPTPGGDWVPAHILVLTVATGTFADLGPGANPAWSPDGRHIAAWRDGNLWLLPYPANSGTPQQITHLPTTLPAAWYVADLLYDPSGRVLLFGGENGRINGNGQGMYVAAVDLRTGTITQLAAPQAVAWARVGVAAPVDRPAATVWPDPVLIDWAISPDGRYLAWEEAPFGGHAISILDLKTNAVQHPAAPASDDHRTASYGLSWSPDNRLALAYSDFYPFAQPNLPAGPLLLYQADLPTLPQIQPLGAGAWPAWNRGRGGRGQPPSQGGY